MTQFSAIMQNATDRIHNIDALMKHRRFIKLEDKECNAIRRIAPYIEHEIPAALDNLYESILNEPTAKTFLSSSQQVDELKRKQLTYWTGIANAQFDLQFAQNVRRVGETHARIGLSPHWYISGYSIVLSQIVSNIIEKMTPRYAFLPPKMTFQELAESISSFCKAVLLDMDLTISVYVDKAKEFNAETLTNERNFVIKSFGQVIDAIANKNISHTITQDLPPAYLPMRDNLNRATLSLRYIMASIRDVTDSLDNTADEINAATQDLAQRTERHAASIEKTAATVDQITTTVAYTEKRVLEASRFVEECQVTTERFAAMIQQATTAMAGIKRSSAAVTKITNVISHIATQTNLLALNTGVEAARAGAAGSGFRILAQEIRKLANRAEDASKEVKELVTTSQSHVNSGSTIMEETSGAISTIITSMAHISDQLKEITKTASEQTAAIRDINHAVLNIDQGTRENAAMVEETSAATANLTQRMRQLQRLLQDFQLEPSEADTLEP